MPDPFRGNAFHFRSARRFLLPILLLNGCSDVTSTDPNTPHARKATEFAEAVVARRFDDAHAMLTRGLQQSVSVDDLEASYEATVGYGAGPVAADGYVATMEEWPDKRPGDVGWAYVSISGEDFVEAIIVVVTKEDDDLKIRDIEWGRP